MHLYNFWGILYSYSHKRLNIICNFDTNKKVAQHFQKELIHFMVIQNH